MLRLSVRLIQLIRIRLIGAYHENLLAQAFFMADEEKPSTLQVPLPAELFGMVKGIAAIAVVDRDALVAHWLREITKQDDGLTQAQLQKKYNFLPKPKREKR